MKRSWAFGLLISSLTWAAPTPVLSGLYSVGELGLVDFSISDGKVIGKIKSSHQCVFAPDTQIVTGAFEGGVFVGTVNLCQEGPASCAATRTYQIMGVFHVDSVAAWLHLDPGCSSPALDHGQLFFRPASLEDKQRVLGPNSATQVAQKLNKRQLAVFAAEAAAEGNRLLAEQKVGPAYEKFRQSVEANETWEGLLGLANTQIKLERYEEALAVLVRAQAAGQASRISPAYLSQVPYNRACIEIGMGDNKAALASLRAAIKMGGAAMYLEPLTTDTDLAKIRPDPEFQRLVAETQIQARRKGR